MDVGTDGAMPSASEVVVLHWTLERRDYLDALRASVAERVWASVRLLILLIAFYAVLLLALPVIEVAVVNRHLTTLPVELAILARLFSWPQVATLAVPMALGAVLVAIRPWWAPELARRRQWRSSPRLHGPWEAVLEPTSITVRRADGETRHRWTAFDAVSEVGLSYRLRLRGTKPPVYTVIPKRAMPGADGPAALGELLRSRVDGPVLG